MTETITETKVKTEIYKIINNRSAFYGQEFELEERVPWRNGTVSLWFAPNNTPTLKGTNDLESSFPETDCELVRIV